MNSRYSSPKINDLWSDDYKFAVWSQVLVCAAQSAINNDVLFPELKGRTLYEEAVAPTPEQVARYEVKNKHEVFAFLNAFYEQRLLAKERDALFFGMTSTDLIDTAQSVRVKESAIVIEKSIDSANAQLAAIERATWHTTALGRTHGQAAELIQFSTRFCRMATDLRMARDRFLDATKAASVCMLSGPVGKYSVLPRAVEIEVGGWLKLSSAQNVLPSTSQVLPRMLIGEVVYSCALLAAAIENAALQIRLLSQHEVGEVSEGFGPQQAGSGSMPHKRNPAACENLCGVARYIRAMVAPSLENVALWHERDISHSSVERIILPDVLEATDYMLNRFSVMLRDLNIDKNRISANVASGFPQVFSHELLSYLVKNGFSRRPAYEKLRSVLDGAERDVDAFIDRFVAEFELEGVSARDDLRFILTWTALRV